MCVETTKARQACRIISNKEIASGIYEMIFDSVEIASDTLPGQFVNLYTRSGNLLLPRPISICEVDKEIGVVKVVYATVGKGTIEFSTYQSGEIIDVLGPVGNGFPVEKYPKTILIGGGVGTPPLLELAKQLEGIINIYLGYRTKPYLIQEFAKFGAVFIATEDGSFGHHGNVIELMDKNNAECDIIYSCGPKPMLNAVKNWAGERNIKAWISLEERMGCGFGACVGCVCKIISDNEIGYTYKKVCKDGPVFNAKEVLF